MKQVLQDFRTGQVVVTEVPVPRAEAGGVLVRNRASLVSAGTERMMMSFGQKSLLQKAHARPDLVARTLDMARREGVLAAFDAVQGRLQRPVELGYSCAGRVIEVGQGVAGTKVGDAVACAGAGYAVHAEIVCVPENLTVALPEGMDLESAAFTTLGAVALQGVRLAEARLGEIVAVIGLGLVGQLAVQILRAAGCLVLGMDVLPERAELARRLGVDRVSTSPQEFVATCEELSAGRGVDAVLIAAGTQSNEPVELAGEVAREKGIVVAVGAVGMTIPRQIYYEKELTFRVSRSYGPGRYDPEYEEKGHDYPYAYVRWTERRNMRAFARLLADGRVDVQPLITHRLPVEEAARAYELVTGETGEPSLGIVLTYPQAPDLRRKVVLVSDVEAASSPAGVRRATSRLSRVRLGVVGAGSFANTTLLPVMSGIPELELVAVASRGGLSARAAADRFGAAYCTSDMQDILDDDSIHAVAILTRHHLHASQVVACLEAGKHVYVEKPLCLNQEELEAISSAYQRACEGAGPGEGHAGNAGMGLPSLTVGFNRRFAPFVVELKRHLEPLREPLMITCRVNAGPLSPNHWARDPAQGGGRLLGEVCHFVDLLIYLAGRAPLEVSTLALPRNEGCTGENWLITLVFGDGSLGTIAYVANGDQRFGKEYLEVFGGGLSARLDDFRALLIAHGKKRVRRAARLRRDKGHRGEWQALVAHLRGRGPEPIPFAELVQSTRATFAAQESLERGRPVELGGERI